MSEVCAKDIPIGTIIYLNHTLYRVNEKTTVNSGVVLICVKFEELLEKTLQFAELHPLLIRPEQPITIPKLETSTWKVIEVYSDGALVICDGDGKMRDDLSIPSWLITNTCKHLVDFGSVFATVVTIHDTYGSTIMEKIVNTRVISCRDDFDIVYNF